jgi:iron complex outermembrane receptor protein
MVALAAGTLVLAASAPVRAQGVPATGRVSGRVVLAGDNSGVHGATIVIVGARRIATTADDGSFDIQNVPEGSYEVIAQREHLSAGRQTVAVVAGQVATVNFELTIEALHEEVAVTASASGASTTFDSFSAVTSLDSLELALNRGTTIADTLANQPGISIRSFGAGNARPIIRGFDGDRVLIMQDGVRTGDLSSQSGDHGVSIDPAGLERLEVVKGPATLLYGSNAIGGVVNAITPQEAFRSTPFTGAIGGMSFDAGSVNGQAGGSGNVQYGQGPWTVWAGGGSRRAGDYESPDGPIRNSGNALHNARFGAGWTGRKLFVSVGGQVERNRFGVPFASELHAHAHGDEEQDEDAGPLDIDIESDRRSLRVDTGLRDLANAFADNVKVTVAATDYTHDELESSGGTESVGTHFENDTQSVRVELEQKRTGRLTGRIGVDWLRRSYRAEGEEALSPPARQAAFSGFVYEELGLGRTRLQLGGRVERTGYRPDARPDAGHPGEDEEDEGHDGDEAHDDHEPPPVRDRTFTAASGSFGVHTDLGRTGAFVVNLTTAARAPALEELYNFGPHAGNLAFEIGSPDLELERTFGIDVSLRRRAERVSGELNLFAYDIRDFVFLDFTGETHEGFREAEFRQADSRFLGMEASSEVTMGRGIVLDAGISLVNARLTATNEPLPRIPALSGRICVDLPWRGVTFSPELVLTAAQHRVFRDETTTSGYGLVNMGASYFVVRGHSTHAITLKGHNLTNANYRLHTSFLKDLAPEVGRGVKLTYTVRFF